MQAGRELDLEVAEALGWKVSKDEGIFCDKDGHVVDEPKFSTTWEGMGLLVEEAEKQGIMLEYEHFRGGRYLGRAWKFCEQSDDWLSIPRDIAIKPPIAGTIPHAVSLVFLRVKGITV
ncbi:hypothetical protein ACWGPW_24225 [Paenibacillus chitinolyticus]